MTETAKRIERPYPGGLDRYDLDSLPFARACYVDGPWEDALEHYRVLLIKSEGTRFEVWTHERIAMAAMRRGFKVEARRYAQRAAEIAEITPREDGARARAIIEALDAEAKA